MSEGRAPTHLSPEEAARQVREARANLAAYDNAVKSNQRLPDSDQERILRREVAAAEAAIKNTKPSR